ncbi:MAG: hypothetical protein ACTHXA_08635 [Gulosibacter sp.]
MHDGKSRIVVAAGSWKKQHAALWDYLVPGSGSAATEQGEVVRITGKVSDEMYRNGGLNWDGDYKALVDALVHLLAGRDSLPADELEAARTLAKSARTGNGSYDEIDGLTALAVKWVARNPEPYVLGPSSYSR